MTTIELKGHINQAGKLEVDLPLGLPEGDVKVIIEILSGAAMNSEIPWEQRPWTEQEIQEALTFHPAQSAAEIIAALDDTSGWWEQQGITDSAAWLEEVRQKEEAERRKW
jgi:hypothetical protein